MFYLTFLTATAAVLSSALPVTPRQDTGYEFSITEYSAFCSSGGCGFSFDVSAPANGDDAPAFSTSCFVTGYDTTYTACDAISDSQTFSAYPVLAADDKLYLKYEYTDAATGSSYDYYGNTTVGFTYDCHVCTNVTDFTVPVTMVSTTP